MLKKILFPFKNHIFIAFLPWVFFAFFYGHSYASQLIGSLGALAFMLVLNFREVRKGFILPWGSILLYVFLAANALFSLVELSAIGTVRLIYSTLAVVVLFSMVVGKPFTLQYAKEEVDSKSWKNPTFLKINWVLTSAWAVLMIIMALPGYFLTFEEIHASWFWRFGLMFLCLFAGIECNRLIPKIMRK